MKYAHIVTVTFNRLEYTIECLKALEEIDAGYPFCVTIVDNGSDDETIKYLKEKERRFRFPSKNIFFEENKGIPYAFNYGWATYSKEYYVKLDNDMVVVKEGWLKDLVEASDKTQNHA